MRSMVALTMLRQSRQTKEESIRVCTPPAPIHHPHASERERQALGESLDEGEYWRVLGEGSEGVEKRCDEVGIEGDDDELKGDAEEVRYISSCSGSIDDM